MDGSGSPKREEEVDAFLRGDPAQLALLEGAVRAIVRSFRFGDADIERDLIQETLSRTLAGLSDHRFLGLASLRTYACNIARYTCLEHIRRRRNEVTFDPDLHPTQDRWGAPEASYLSTEEHRRNLEAFASLPEQCRELLQMICLEGVSYREAACTAGHLRSDAQVADPPLPLDLPAGGQVASPAGAAPVQEDVAVSCCTSREAPLVRARNARRP